MQQTTQSAQYTDKMTEYLNGRWESQRKYYSEKSAFNRKWYQALQLFIAVGSVAVPVLIGIVGEATFVPIILSGLVAAAAAIQNVYHFGDKWRNFREALEALKRERVLFDTGVGPYKDPDTAFSKFVARSEDIMAQESGSYFQYAYNSKQNPSSGGDVTQS